MELMHSCFYCGNKYVLDQVILIQKCSECNAVVAIRGKAALPKAVELRAHNSNRSLGEKIADAERLVGLADQQTFRFEENMAKTVELDCRIAKNQEDIRKLIEQMR